MMGRKDFVMLGNITFKRRSNRRSGAVHLFRLFGIDKLADESLCTRVEVAKTVRTLTRKRPCPWCNSVAEAMKAEVAAEAKKRAKAA